MKIGTFVGVEGIKMNADEREYVESQIADAMAELSLDYSIGWMGESQIISQARIVIPSLMGKGKCYRTGSGNLVRPEYIRLQFMHDKGYDEAEWGPIYDRKKPGTPTCDMDSYSSISAVTGHEKAAHSRRVDNWSCLDSTGYHYGTELDDLDVKGSFKAMVRRMTNWRRVGDRTITWDGDKEEGLS